MNKFFTEKLLKEHQLNHNKSAYIFYDLVKRITDYLNYFINSLYYILQIRLILGI